MRDEPSKSWLRWIGGSACALLLLLATIVLALLVLTKQLVRIAVMRIFPGNTLSVGETVLSLSGALTLRDCRAARDGFAAAIGRYS